MYPMGSIPGMERYFEYFENTLRLNETENDSIPVGNSPNDFRIKTTEFDKFQNRPVAAQMGIRWASEVPETNLLQNTFRFYKFISQENESIEWSEPKSRRAELKIDDGGQKTKVEYDVVVSTTRLPKELTGVSDAEEEEIDYGKAPLIIRGTTVSTASVAQWRETLFDTAFVQRWHALIVPEIEQGFIGNRGTDAHGAYYDLIQYIIVPGVSPRFSFQRMWLQNDADNRGFTIPWQNVAPLYVTTKENGEITGLTGEALKYPDLALLLEKEVGNAIVPTISVGAWRVHQREDGKVDVTDIICANAGGKVPLWVVNLATRSNFPKLVGRIRWIAENKTQP